MKKIKEKIRKMLNLIFIIFMILGLRGVSIATDATQNPKYIGIIDLKPESGMGYAIGDPTTGGITNTAAKLWNLIEYSSETSDYILDTNLYCLKAEQR